MPDDTPPQSSIVLYQTEDGRTRIQCRFENETIWLTQAQIGELFQVTVPTVNEHLKWIFADGELDHEATIRKFRIVRLEGSRQVEREIEHYRLEAILAVGYRVRSTRGTRQLRAAERRNLRSPQRELWEEGPCPRTAAERRHFESRHRDLRHRLNKCGRSIRDVAAPRLDTA